MPLKLQAHVDSRIWSLQSTVSFFFLSSIWFIEVLFAAHIRFSQNSFFVLRTKSSASMALTKTKNKQKKNNINKTKQPPLKKQKNQKQQQTNKKQQQKNNNKQKQTRHNKLMWRGHCKSL